MWKDQDQDVADMCVSAESLLGTLTILSKTVQPPAKFDRSATENVEKHVERIKPAMNKLCDELGQAQGPGLQKHGTRALMRRHIRRALYPFRELTLLKIRQNPYPTPVQISIPLLNTLQLLVTLARSRKP